MHQILFECFDVALVFLAHLLQLLDLSQHVVSDLAIVLASLLQLLNRLISQQKFVFQGYHRLFVAPELLEQDVSRLPVFYVLGGNRVHGLLLNIEFGALSV